MKLDSWFPKTARKGMKKGTKAPKMELPRELAFGFAGWTARVRGAETSIAGEWRAIRGLAGLIGAGLAAA